MSQITARFNSGSYISKGDKEVFWNHDQPLEVVLLFPQKAEAMKGIQAILGFPELKIVKPSDTRWLSHKCCIKSNLQGTASIVVNPFSVIRVIWRCCGIWHILPFG